jgi:hypothetical protein
MGPNVHNELTRAGQARASVGARVCDLAITLNVIEFSRRLTIGHHGRRPGSLWFHITEFVYTCLTRQTHEKDALRTCGPLDLGPSAMTVRRAA